MDARIAVLVGLSALAAVACGQAPGGSNHAKGMSEVNSMPGGMVSIQCSVHPGGHVLWYKQDDAGKMELARDSLLIVSDRRYQLKSDNGAYILTIQPTEESDSGTYMCESSDQHGSTYNHTFKVNIGVGSGASRTAAATVGTIAAAVLLLL